MAARQHVHQRHAALIENEIHKPPDFHVYDNPKGMIYITHGCRGGLLESLASSRNYLLLKGSLYTYASMSIEDNTVNYEVFNQEIIS